MPLFPSAGRLDDEDMLLAVLLTAGFLGLLVAVGRLTDELLGGQAERWAGRIVSDMDPQRHHARAGDRPLLAAEILSGKRDEMLADFRPERLPGS